MATPGTEQIHPLAEGLDARPLGEAAEVLFAGQVAALAAVEAACGKIAEAGALMADTLRGQGRLIYAAAGSSGLMALADASELGATFGIPDTRIALHMAGGVPVDAVMPGATEDDAAAARAAAADLRPEDLVIALSASGTTPYPLAFLEVARSVGARSIAIANNAGAPIFDLADVAIVLATPPEVIAGSTRMGAGTAQKVALNMISSLAGIALGHVHDGMMVNMRAENAKLRQRAAGMVARIAGVPEAAAADCLARTDGNVKPAILLAAGAGSLAKAEELLEQSQGHLRAALALI